MAGTVSLDDWDMLTWSLGCTGEYSPRPAPSSSFARLARTSFVFMLCEVPAPAWKRSTTNCSRHRPSARISSAAATIARPNRSSRWPVARLERAAAFLTSTAAQMKSG